jgi:hypothetical protein
MYHVWERDAYRVLAGKLTRKREHGSPRLRWEDNIKMDLLEMVWRGGA